MEGITPTYMGNTTATRTITTSNQDHPHIHGEYDPGLPWNAVVVGSPPHTWGIPTWHGGKLNVLGITPTYMGNTGRPSISGIKQGDHPHIHGEYRLSSSLNVRRWGSPPHTWGIPLSLVYSFHAVRITPTYMGNTSSSGSWFTHSQDHPHIHGEYCSVKYNLVSSQGSPPHTWGILVSFLFIKEYGRITPTYMGNTMLDVVHRVAGEDHPHIHGEY